MALLLVDFKNGIKDECNIQQEKIEVQPMKKYATERNQDAFKGR
jgi:hypothetical protein